MIALLLAAALSAETVVVQSGGVALHGMVWRPEGPGPFPAILFNHGSGRPSADHRPDAGVAEARRLGPVFARHGYLFFHLFRRGVGLSADAGANATDLMQAAPSASERNAVQLKLLEGRDLDDARAGLAFLRASAGADPRRLAVVGHSFGGALSLLLAASERDLRAAVVFGAAAFSWDRSPSLRARLIEAAAATTAPIFIIQAKNDLSTAPSLALDAELTRLHKPHRLAIYPPIGKTAEEGHDLPYLAVDKWEPDVFPFLDQHVARSR